MYLLRVDVHPAPNGASHAVIVSYKHLAPPEQRSCDNQVTFFALRLGGCLSNKLRVPFLQPCRAVRIGELT